MLLVNHLCIQSSRWSARKLKTPPSTWCLVSATITHPILRRHSSWRVLEETTSPQSLSATWLPLSPNPLSQLDAHRITRRRAKVAGIETRIGNHTFRATGITAYLKNSGKLEVAQQIANHESPRTTKLYDRRNDEISLDEIERITI
jgi:integrase